MSADPPGEGDGKRRAYLVVLTLALLVDVAVWVMQDPDDALTNVTYGLAVALTAVPFVIIWRRWLPLHLAERMLFGLVVVLLSSGVLLVSLRATPQAADPTTILQIMLWIAVLFPLAFLVFGTRRGLHVSLAMYVIFIATFGPVALAHGGDDGVGMRQNIAMVAFNLAGIYAVAIALLWVLASRLERLTEARTEVRVLSTQALTDPLTGIANRRRLDDEGERLLALATRHGHPLSAILVDLDHFKSVNDRFGHDVGDDVLVHVVQRLDSVTREADLLGRWGGEEFLILASNTDLAGARELAERCRTAIDRAPIAAAGSITASFGVATLEPGDDRRSLLRRADLALHTAKYEGRNRVITLRSATGHGGQHPVEGRT